MKGRVAEEKQVKLMESAISCKTRVVVRGIFVAVSLNFLWSGCYKLSLVEKMMEGGGIVFNDLFSEIDFLKMYSGVYLEAIRQFYRGLFDILSFSCCCISWFLCELCFNWKKLLLRMIEKEGGCGR